MSGYVVTTDNGKDLRNLFMVNGADPKAACAEINKFMGVDNAEALTLLSAAQLDYFEVKAGTPWLFTTVHSPTGRVTSSQLR